MVKPRHINTKHHEHHLHALVRGTSQEGRAHVAYGSKKFHDAILHTMEKAREAGAHLQKDVSKAELEVIEYLGNNRINKTERTAHIMKSTQTGGGWKKFWRGFKKGFTSVVNPQNIATAVQVAALL